MKKSLSKWGILALFILVGLAGNAEAAKIEKMNKKELQALSETQVQERLLLLESRVSEIQAMDVASLPTAERREVAKELREIKKQNDFLSGGVYLSVGAIIIILLVLILLT